MISGGTLARIGTLLALFARADCFESEYHEGPARLPGGPFSCDAAASFFTVSARSTTAAADASKSRVTLIAIEAPSRGSSPTPSLKNASVVPGDGANVTVLDTRANDQLLEVEVDTTSSSSFNLQVSLAETCFDPYSGKDGGLFPIPIHVVLEGPDGGTAYLGDRGIRL